MAKRKKPTKAERQAAARREAENAILRRLHVGRFSVTTKKVHQDGSSAGEATAYGDAVTELHVGGDKHELAATLRELARVVACSEDDFGGGHVVLVRRYSHDFLKRLRGG